MAKLTTKPTKRTSITLSGDVKDRLASLGRKGDTYEEILIKLLDFWDESH